MCECRVGHFLLSHQPLILGWDWQCGPLAASQATHLAPATCYYCYHIATKYGIYALTPNVSGRCRFLQRMRGQVR